MLNITFTSDPLPPDFMGTLEDFRQRFLLNLRGTIEDTEVLTGRIGGSKPTTDIGPWLYNGSWWAWNGSDYVPTTVKVGNSQYAITLSYDLNGVADRIQALQDADGTIALLSDVYVGRPTVNLSGTTPTIDSNLSDQFLHILSGNTTYKVNNMQDGQEIVVASKNSGTSFTVTWPSSVFWTGGTPVQTALKTDLYFLYNIGGSIIGRQVAGYA